jgi:hypothetical protein
MAFEARRSWRLVGAGLAALAVGALAAPPEATAGCPAGQVEDDDGRCKPATKATATAKPTATAPPTATVPPKPTVTPPPTVPPKPTVTAPPTATVPPKPTATAKPPPPPKDRDGDGLVDASDSCPDVAEDQNGFEDGDGCPDEAKRQAMLAARDDDGDGVRNADDRCPSAREDENGFEDGDGCPDEARRQAVVAGRDDDGDGFANGNDKCPSEAEDANGFEDDDGCPDEPKRREAEAKKQAERERLERAQAAAAEWERAAGAAGGKRAAGVALLVGGLASFGAVAGLVAWREQLASDVLGLPPYPTLADLQGVVDTANLATGLAVGTGILGATLVGIGIPLIAAGKVPPKPSEADTAQVRLVVLPGGLSLGGVW